ncbi:MAG: peptide chain release factor 1 [Candidatus Eisenbacteria bacterium]|nr:peptide chain release factor 1 [Candidatus Eisenbacteria bacterium]
MFEQIQNIISRYDELTQMLADPAVLADPQRLRETAKERGGLEPVVEKWKQYSFVAHNIAEDEQIIESSKDQELVGIARSEVEELRTRLSALEGELRELLRPKDPNDDKNVIVEIRAGTGGEEAALFAADLSRMYMKYAESKGWKVELMNRSTSDVGGFKEIIFLVEGKGAYSFLRYESGVHRVQRVPVTEASGRIHTSAVTVAILPEAEDVDIQIDPKDLEVDVFRSSGPGGQSVNTADSAVRVKHIPTGLVVQCQDERSQLKNKAKALKVLKARLLAAKQEEQETKIANERRAQVSTGDRSAKIRTYNFPQGRVTDHRIGLTLYQLDQVLDGRLDELVEALRAARDKLEMGAAAGQGRN